MATTVEVPQLGNTVEECLITRWVKRKGDSVAEGEVVAEIETDKTTFEVTAPVAGTLLETFFEEGALVPVFTKLFVIGRVGERVERAGRSGAFSPRARKFAEQHDFQPAAIVGSGPGGRVLEQDMRKAYEGLRFSTPVSNTRQTIARRMRESLASTAQYTLNTSADAGGLLALRARFKESQEVARITINDLVAFCTIRALMDATDLNVAFIDGRIVRHSEVHLAFACDTARGLIAPVVRDAHTLSIVALSERMTQLSAQALDGTITAGDVTGATFTISNLGSLGVESFTPVLNPPQVALLGVGAIQLKPVRREGRVDFIDAIGLSLTCDHQVIDGAPGARFLQILKQKIETVESLV